MVNDLINSAVSKIRDTATKVLGTQAVKTISQVGGELAQSAKTIGSIGAGYLSGYAPFLPNLPTQAKQQARDYLKQRGAAGVGVDVLRGVGAVTNPIGYAAYRSFPAVYGAIGPKKQGESALDAALRGIQEYAGPSRALGIEGTRTGKILDTGEMIAGLALNKGIDDLAIKGIRKTGAKIGLKLGAYGGEPYVTDFTTVNNARQRLALLWPKRGGYLTNDDLDFLTQAEKNAEIYRDAFKLMSHQEWSKLDLVRKYDMISEKLENMVRSGQQPIMGIVDPAMSKNVNPRAASEVTQAKIKAKPAQMTPEQGFQTASSLPSTKQRKFIKTVLESRQATDDLKEAVAKVPQTYNPISNVETLAKAEKAVSANPEAVFKKVTGDTLPKDEPYTDLIAQGEALMSRLQKEGKFDEAAQVAESLARKGTELGQSVQAFSIWSRLTPEGMLRYAAKEIKQANESRGFLDRLFKTRSAVLTPELAQSITAKMTQVQQMPAGTARDKLVREVLQEISENIPPGVSELFDAYRYQNLLSSPRTQLRNVYGNLFQSFVTKPATMVFDGGVDFVRSALTGTERRAYISDVPTYYKGLLNSFPNAINAFAESWKGLSAVKQPDIQGLRTAAMPGSLTFITRFMEGMDKFQQAMLGAGFGRPGF